MRFLFIASSIYADDSQQYGFIDKSGKMVINTQFDDAKCFSAGLAPVAINRKWGYTAGYYPFRLWQLWEMAVQYIELRCFGNYDLYLPHGW